MEPVLMAGCVIMQDAKLLLLHRTSKDWYELPGGKVDAGEDPASAAVREIKEELGCDVAIVRALGSADFVHADRAFHYLWFLAHLRSGAPRAMESHVHDSCKFFTVAELSNVRLSPNMELLLEHIRAKNIQL